MFDCLNKKSSKGSDNGSGRNNVHDSGVDDVGSRRAGNQRSNVESDVLTVCAVSSSENLVGRPALRRTESQTIFTGLEGAVVDEHAFGGVVAGLDLFTLDKPETLAGLALENSVFHGESCVS